MSNGEEASGSIFVGTEAESLLLTLILSDRGLHEGVFLVIVRGGGPTSRSMAGHPIARLARLTGQATRRSVESVSRRSSGRRTRRRR